MNKLLQEWADSCGVTLPNVSVNDLLTLIEMVERTVRDQCAEMIEGSPFMDGPHAARKGPCGVGSRDARVGAMY